MDSDRSLSDQAQAFVKSVQIDVEAIKAVSGHDRHNENERITNTSNSHRNANGRRSFSSISSRDEDNTTRTTSFIQSSFPLEEIPRNFYHRETLKSINGEGNVNGDNEDNEDDEAAKIMLNHVERRGSLNITNLLAERANAIESITWLGRHVPQVVMKDLSREVIRLHKHEASELDMPCANEYRAALLFIDISGFTKLSLLLELESFSKTINSYFQKIVDEVTSHGGDVLKFAGDAIFAEWRIKVKQEPHQTLKEEREEIDRCVHKAASCGASVVAKCSDYPVLHEGDNGLPIAMLNVHCGLAFGSMAAVHVGNDYSRREFLILGETIDQVTKACSAATYGELFASVEAYDILQGTTAQKMRFSITKQKKKVSDPVLIASKNQYFFVKKKQRSFKGRTRRPLPLKEYIIPFDAMDITSLRYLQKMLSFYVHPVVVRDDKFRPNIIGDAQQTQERQRSEVELRSVYTIFIKPIIKAELTSDPNENKNLYKLLNDTLNLVTSILDSFKGHLRQFIVDDKGVILIATFGLRGSTSPNMATERVLPASRIVHYALQNELGINNFVGVTLGKVYCGIVGGIKRHEYAVLGPSVNLSARLLGMANHPGILVDDTVRQEATSWGNFLPFPPMKAKGYADLVPVYQPLTAREARWGKVNPHFVGRRDEMNNLCNLAKNMAMAKGPAQIFFVWGESGSGKSDFLVQTVALTRKALISIRKAVVVLRHIGSDGDSLVPFSTFRSIFRDLLAEPTIGDNSSIPSKFSKNDSASVRDRDWESMSLSSISTLNTSKIASNERLNEICTELQAPRGFIQIVGYHLLGHGMKNTISNSKEKTPVLDEIVDFMAKVFIHCTSHANLTVVALDDMHHTDNMSWRVIQKIFETGENILFVCGSRPTTSRKLNIDDDFWKSLNGIHKKSMRFHELHIGPLDQSEITEMAAIALSCKKRDVDVQFTKDIFDHTRGMPHFAAQALKICKKKSLCERLSNNKTGWRKGTGEFKMLFSTLDELLLQRIDDLDDFTRKVLHLASVLGHTFKMSDIIGISEQVLSIADNDKMEHTLKIGISLDNAVEEGIIEESVRDTVNVSKVMTRRLSRVSIPSLTVSRRASKTSLPSLSDLYREEKNDDSLGASKQSYQFCHDTWRQKILSLLLDSYKQDIHRHAASAIESEISDLEEVNYRTKMKLFRHLKESGNKSKSTELALNVGKNFMYLGLNLHSIRVFEDALDVWHKDKNSDNDDTVAGFSCQVIESLDESDLISLIKLQTALGQALGTLDRKKESAQAFEDALEVFSEAPVSAEIRNRSVLFPIYSGLFFLLKYGGMIEPGQELAYEHNLVTNFVEETRLNGDPVHYSRSLAMQGEFYSRQGQYEDAIFCHERLKRTYNVDQHSALVIENYATDRSAQNFGITANCLYRLGRVEEALDIADTVLSDMLPKMDPKNVHNSMIMMYPLLWILKNEKMAEKAVTAMEEFVFEPFRQHFGNKGKTPLLPLYKPIKALFTIAMYLEGQVEVIDESMISWALEPASPISVSKNFDTAMANFGRCGSSIGAEICLHLSKYTKSEDTRKELMAKGWKLCQTAMETANKCGSHQTTYFETKPIYDEYVSLNNKSDEE